MSWLISSILSAEISIAKKRGEVAVTNHTEIQLPTLLFLPPWRQTSLSIDSCIGRARSIFPLCYQDRTNSFQLLLIAAGRVVPRYYYHRAYRDVCDQSRHRPIT